VRENKLRIRPKASLCEVDEAEMTVLNLLLATHEEVVVAPATMQQRAHTLMALARAGKIKPTPIKEEPMTDVQKWIDELRAGKVVGRIVLKN
jgi:D-arabinose 1-dehydrogenase-like Zn-dependent alcohol dehydrogenase